MGKVMYLKKGEVHTKPITMPPIGSPISEFKPEEIQEIARDGQGPNYWSVGDMVPITLNGTVGGYTFRNETYYAFIIGFDHNSSREGSNTIHFQFGKTSAGVDIAFVDSGYASSGSSAGYRMNTSDTNTGGWKSSYMRSTICPAFKAAMPTAWQNVIAACTKYSDNTGGSSNTSSNVTATSDDIFCLSELEMRGSKYYSNSAEPNYQKQYDYYKAGNSKVKYKHNATTTICRFWTRSVAYDSYAQGKIFCHTENGNTGNSWASYSYGFAPGFVVA